MPRRLILASASPRRRELLALLGLPFDVVASDIDESAPPDASPEDLAVDLSRRKAAAVSLTYGDALVLGADTVVVAEDAGRAVMLGKPSDADDARRMLALLSGAAHTVYTGVALADRRGGRPPNMASALVGTQVRFRELSPPMIDAYVATGEPYDKAGAYGIQGGACPFVEAVDGDYFNVVGLPVATVAHMLEAAGVAWWQGERALR